MANIFINQGTQTAIANDTVGSLYYQTIKLDMGATGTTNAFTGTIPEITNLTTGTITKVQGGTIQTNLLTGTLTSLAGGSVAVTAATINTGTINAGTINRIGAVGTIEVGTITTLPNIPGGSIQVTNGTINTGTINVATVVLNSATISVLPNLPQGSIQVTAGTISVLPNLPQGSINVTAGTFRLNPAPTVVTSSYGTTTTGTIGTLVAAPSAGSAIFITSLDVNVQNGTAETLVSYGLVTNGNQVVNRGNYVGGGGIAKVFSPANSGSSTGTALTFNILSGAATVSYNLAYFIAVP